MAYRRILPTQEYLQECFSYNPDTGYLTWNNRPRERFASRKQWLTWNKKHAGKIAGHGVERKPPVTYTQWFVHIDGEGWLQNRIVWKWCYGTEPPHSIDHEDTDPSNNRIENLRPATDSQNAINRKLRYDSKTGYKGVSFMKNKKTKKYKATICVRGQITHLGFFNTAEEAYAMYCEAAKNLHGEFIRLS